MPNNQPLIRVHSLHSRNSRLMGDHASRKGELEGKEKDE
jgi:hypothetical protein